MPDNNGADIVVGDAYRPDIQNAAASFQRTLDKYKPGHVLQSPEETRSIQPMNRGEVAGYANKMIAETVNQVQGDVNRAINLGTGFTPYVLETPARVIFPVRAPLVQLTPRVVGKGTDIEHWKSVISVFNSGGPFSQTHLGGVTDGGTTIDSPVYVLNNYQASYQTIAEYNSVSFQAQWRNRALEGDMLARRKLELLYALKLQEENWLINGASKMWAPAPALVSGAAAPVGTFAAATYWVLVTATNAQGETLAFGGSTAVASKVTLTLNQSLNVTFTGVPWATSYDVYIGTGSTQPANTAMWKTAAGNYTGGVKPSQPTDYIGSMSITANILVNNTSGTAYSATVTAGNLATVNTNLFDGALSLCYLNPISSTSLSVGEAGMTSVIVNPTATTGLLALQDLQLLFRKMYSQAGADPEKLFVSPVEGVTIDNLAGTASNFRIYAEPNSAGGINDLTIGQKVRKVLNQVTGSYVDVVTLPYLPQGTIMAGSFSIPFPAPTQQDAPFRVVCNQDYTDIDYPPAQGAPQTHAFGYFVDETLVNQYQGGWGVIQGIQPAAGV